MSPTSNGVPEADVAKVLPVKEKVDRTITGKVLEPCDKVTGDVPEPSPNLITTESEVETVAIEVPSVATEPIEICEYGVMKASVLPHEGGSQKPRGSANVRAKMQVIGTDLYGEADVCVDTGADITVCTSAYLVKAFNQNVLQHIDCLSRLPRLLSATGHLLKILGRIHLKMLLGTFPLQLKVVVQDNAEVSNFLLGSDAFYGRMIFDRGKYLAFSGGVHLPVPIKYKLEQSFARVVTYTSIAPRSSALVPVHVTSNTQLIGQSIILSHNCNLTAEVESWESSPIDYALVQPPVRDTVASINSDGSALVMVQNITEDYLIFPQDTEIAKINLIQSDGTWLSDETEVVYSINHAPEIGEENWIEKALNSDFLGKKLPNLHMRGDSLADAEEFQVNFVHSKEDRKQLLDGTGDSFPMPPAAEPFEKELEASPEAWLDNIEHSHLTEDEWAKLKQVLIDHREAFSRSKTDIGCCRYFKAELPLKEGTGYLYSKPRPLPLKHKEIARQTINDLLEQGIIRPSKSPHATNIVVVNKKALNGVVQHRVCVDLRQVNEHSIPNRFPNFQVEEAMAKIQGAALRTSFDFCNAFHQIMLTEESIPVTAFYFDNMLYEYVRVPFGHVCAMNLFCNVMALLCEGYAEAGYYADDLMVTTKTNPRLSKVQIFDMHLVHISGMLKRIIDAGLKLKAHKCQWCFGADKPMEWLGFTMQNNYLKPQQAKVDSVKNWPTPISVRQCQAFIGLTSFYRKFIKSFARIAIPIHGVIHAETFEWTHFAQEAFELLKEAMCSEPVLKMPRQELPFIMYSDASHRALGVVLCQIDPDDGKEHPCAYGSRKFNDAELRYSTPCKELLAIIYGLCLWYHYIVGNPVRIYSDCRAWTFLKVQTGISGKISRLALLVQEYDMTVSFVQGAKNKAADGLSRAWDTEAEPCDDQSALRHPALEKLQAPSLEEGQSMRLTEYMDFCDPYVKSEWPRLMAEYDKKPDTFVEEEAHVDDVIKVSQVLFVDRDDQRLAENAHQEVNQVETCIEIVGATSYTQSSSGHVSVQTVHDEPLTTEGNIKQLIYNIRLVVYNDSFFTIEAFIEAQQEDPFCKEKICQLALDNPVVKGQGYFNKKVGSKQYILMRQFTTQDFNEVFQVVCVPKALVKYLLESSHGNLLHGHLGKRRYLLNMTRKYYWPKMRTDIEQFHDKCLPCQLNDKYPVRYTLGTVIRPLKPMHIVYYDIVLGLPRSVDGNHAILLFYDGFTRFTFGIPLASEKADYIVKKVMSHFVAAFGLPWALHSDNGMNVDGSMIRHLARMLGVVKTTTPPYTPRANPCETACGAVSMLIRKVLYARDQKYWSQCLPFVLNALNSTVHTVTGFAPNALFFGRNGDRALVPLIPVADESANVNDYYRQLRRFQDLAYQIAKARTERQKAKTFDTANDKARTPKFEVGDFVLVKDQSPGKGPGQLKLRAKYTGPYRVIHVYPASLVVIPWSEGKNYEIYKKNPDLLRLRHRADIRPFHPIQVSVAHCKPYKGEVEPKLLWDDKKLTEFLELLDTDNESDLQSITVPSDSGRMSSESGSESTGDSSFHPRPPGPPGPGGRPPDDWDDSDDDDFPGPDDHGPPGGPGPHDPPDDDDSDSSLASLSNILDASFDDLEFLRGRIIPDDQLSQASDDALELHEYVQDLLQEVAHPDPWIREQAQREVRNLVDNLRAGDVPNSVGTSGSTDSQASHGPVPHDKLEAKDPLVEDLGPDPEGEIEENRPPKTPSTADSFSDSSSSGFTIHTNKFDIKISPKRPGQPKVFRRHGSDDRTLSGVPPDQPDPPMLQMWVDHTKPKMGIRSELPTTPSNVTITRSGRASRRPERYDADVVDRQQAEARDFEKARRNSLNDSAGTPSFRFGEWLPRTPASRFSGRSRIGRTPPGDRSNQSTPAGARGDAADVADEPNDADDLDEAIKDDYENPKPGPSHKE